MEPPASKPPRPVLIALALALAVVAAYSATFGFGLVGGYDDDEYIKNHTAVTEGLSLDNVRWAFTTEDFYNYHPVTWVSYQLDATLFGSDYRGFHATNVAIHVATCVLLFLVLYRATGSIWRSAAVALLFALHPTRVESVAWLAERKDVLCGAFGMGSLLAYVHYARRPSVPRMTLVAALLALGLLSKATIITWPAVMLLMDFWPLRRMRSPNRGDAPSLPPPGLPPGLLPAAPATPLRLVVEKIPLLLLALAGGAAAYHAQNHSGAVVSIEALPIGARLANVIVGYVRYIGLTLWPFDLSAWYPPRQWSVAQVAACGVVLAAVSAAAVILRRARPSLFVGWFWFLGTLVPMVGLVQLSTQAIADRYTYIPQMGLLIAIVWGVADLLAATRSRLAPVALTVALIVALGVTTWRQTLYWRNAFDLWSHADAVTRDNSYVYEQLYKEYFRRGQLEVACRYAVQAARLAPRLANVQFDAAVLLLRLGKPAEAVHHLRLAANNKLNDPGSFSAQLYLGLALRDTGQLRDAQAVFDSLVKNPAVPHHVVAAEFTSRNEFALALPHFRVYLESHPDDAIVHNAFGVALIRCGDAAGAAAQFTEALRLNPDFAMARENLDAARALPPGEKEKP